METARFSSEFKDGFFFFSYKSVSVDWLGLSLTTACGSSGIKTLLVLRYQSCSIAVSQGQHWLLVCSSTSFEFRVGLLLLTQQEAHFWAKRASFHELQCWKLAAPHRHQAFSSVLSEFDGKGSVILILFSSCM